MPQQWYIRNKDNSIQGPLSPQELKELAGKKEIQPETLLKMEGADKWMHAAKAALLKVEVETNSHKGARSMFGFHLVKPGLIEKEYAMILTAVQEDRELGDYAIGIQIEQGRAEERVEQASRFLERVKGFVQD